jgi:hypothetical protein
MQAIVSNRGKSGGFFPARSSRDRVAQPEGGLSLDRVEDRGVRESALNGSADHLKDWLTLMLAGLGVTYLPHEWIGGIFLALAGAAFAMRADPEQDMRELWLVLLGAFLAAHLAGMLSARFLPELPVQSVMAMTGFFSRRITRFALRLAGLVEARSDRIADRVVDHFLPDKRRDKIDPDN